ncbi:MAG: hypothetical protein LBQ64_03495 [Bacteroidales bacterium]|jgi:hypothetical protein|nr:hypothetical protein [Bacteroidales bacterium]
MKLRLLFIVLMIYLISMSMFGQGKIILKGKIVDFVTWQALEHTCIHNLSTGLMVFSNASGDFAMLAGQKDTLAISRVGYDMEMIFITDSLRNSKERIVIPLVMRSLILRNVTIHAMKPYPLFIKDLVKASPQRKIDIEGIEISPLEKAGYDINKGNLLRGTPLASPITFLYDKFSHKAKMGRMYAGLLENQEEVMRLAQKYNSDIVHRITKLEGEKLEDFMLYCSFTYYILAISSDVEIEQMIAAKYLQYKRENGL